MSNQLDTNVRILFSQLGIRPSPEFSTSEVARRLLADHGVTLTEVNGTVECQQNGATVSTGTVLKAFALKESNADLFILANGVARSRADFKGDSKAMSDYVSKHGGAAFEKLMSAQSLKPAVPVMNADELDRESYKHLTRAEKMRIVDAVGVAGVQRIMARRPKVTNAAK